MKPVKRCPYCHGPASDRGCLLVDQFEEVILSHLEHDMDAYTKALYRLRESMSKGPRINHQ